ncbi:IS91 family transposase [Desulfitibacter alkalitolerans]|uniref:IS91 family transposase n=1 Tax=Desulfitibacter alkalitolerans TaxID=264641 RepID=UPI0004800136|nr:IS91 family transposase [Desulfitibacter alkalitolerans]
MIEVADVFRKHGTSYRQAHKLPYPVHKAMGAIESCRTAQLGGHVDECNTCGHLKISYNSCRNRHCPKCQGLAKEKWLDQRKKDLLPVQYFHVVFTIPDELNPIALRNKREVYSILLKAASETLLELGKDPKHLGAQVGFTAILHTWGQNLLDHPHLHCVVPGGGLSLDGDRWIPAKEDFFIPVKVMSRLFRGKFLDYIKKAYVDGDLNMVGTIQPLNNPQSFNDLLSKLYKKEWVVYCKPPFGSPEHVIEYLGRYTHRIAISNNRIANMDNDKVTFNWRDYSDDNKNKLMTLEAFEFIRRFLLHVLPDSFVKIRHFGILSNCNRKTKLKKCQQLLSVEPCAEEKSNKSWEELYFELTGTDLRICPCCEKGKMIRKEPLHPRQPPHPKRLTA